VEAMDYLGKETQHDTHHTLTSKVMDATAAIPQPHIFEANLTVPVKEDPETGTLNSNGFRTLNVELRSADMPKRPERISGACTKFSSFGAAEEQRVLASATFDFNTKRLLSVSGNVWYDGRDIGLEHASIVDGSNKNFLLRYLADMAGLRSLSVARAADFVTAVSMDNAQSLERTWASVDIDQIARDIRRHTGRTIPLSLRDVPQLFYESNRQLTSAENAPTIARSTYTIDRYDKGRIITDWEMTQYNLFTPADPQHLAFYDVLDLSHEPIGTCFGIDVHQNVLASEDESKKDHYATTEAEAREMVNPLIYAVASLRRYYAASAQERLTA